MITIIYRTIIIYAILLCAVRLMGKRQLGDLELSEFVITILLSEIAIVPIADKSVKLLHSIVPILLLVSLEALVAFLSLKSRTVKKTVSGCPTILIKKGKLCKSEMAKERVTLDALLCELRLKNIYDVSEVDYAILEENGQISVLQKSWARTATAGDIGIEKKEDGIFHPIVVDGQVSDFNLKLCSHNRKWLKNQLKKRGLKSRDVFLMTVNDTGEINIIKNGDVL